MTKMLQGYSEPQERKERIVSHGVADWRSALEHEALIHSKLRLQSKNKKSSRLCSGMDMSPNYQAWPQPFFQGTVKGGRRQGGQRKRWEDNIREWTGLGFSKSQRAVKNREHRENWFQNHLWCPNDPRGWGIDDDDDVTSRTLRHAVSDTRVVEKCN